MDGSDPVEPTQAGQTRATPAAGGTDLELAPRRHLVLRIAVTPLVFLLSIPVAVLWPSKAPYTWLSLVVLNAVLSWIDPARDQDDEADA